MSPNIQFNSGAVRAGDCISDGLAIIQPNYFLYVGICLLAFILTGCIPILNYFLLGPVSVGVYYAINRQMRNEPVDFGMMFKGFEKFVPAMVIGLITAIPQIAGDVLQYTARFAQIFAGMSSSHETDTNYFAQNMQGFPEFALSGGIIAIIIIFVILIFIFAIAWGITFYFTLPLLSEYDLSIGEAVSLGARAGWANWSGIFVLSIFQGLVMIAGALLLCIGLFFVLPIVYGSKMVAYRQVFPDNQNLFNNEPPRPDAYGGTYGMPQKFG